MDLKLLFYIPFHPFKGFWEMKYEQRGNRNVVLIILLAMIVTTVLSSSYTGFLLNQTFIEDVNILAQAVYVIFPFLLFCTCNWCITTLMQGEGSFKDIAFATAYALVPMIIIEIPMIFISNFVTLEEVAFVRFFYSFSTIWFIGLLFFGIMTVHQYTVKKTVATFILTILAMGISVFIMLLLFSLYQQIYVFFKTIYEELRL